MSADLPELARALRRLTDADLGQLVGAASLRRGQDYASQRRVAGLRVTGPRGVRGTVRGQGRVYATQVDLSREGRFLGGDCTCPLGGDCKHVVAVALTARQTLGLAGGPADDVVDLTGAGSPSRPVAARPAARALRVVPPSPPAWEVLLGSMAVAVPAATEHTPLGLLFEVNHLRPGGYRTGHLPGRAWITIRPVIPGKTGWVRTGVSWGRLDYLGYAMSTPAPRQREALHRVLAFQAASHRYHPPSDGISLEHLGGGWLEVLRYCRHAGVSLLTDQRHSGAVRISEQPARVVLDLTRAPDGDIRAVPSIVLPDGFDDAGHPGAGGDPAAWTMVGSPPLGLWRQEGSDLLLAEFDHQLDEQVTRLLEHGPVEVPSADAERFLSGVVPLLARRLELTSLDGSVPITEIARPRLHVHLVHGPGVRLTLAWSFRYHLGSQTVGFELGSSDQSVIRDPGAEAELVDSVVAELPPRLVTPPGALGAMPHPTCTLTGFEVVDVLDRVVPRLAELPGVEVELDGEPVDYVEAAHPPTVRLALTDGGQARNDWFDLSIAVSVGDENVPIASLVTALTLGQDQVILPSGTWFRVDRPELADLRRLIEEARAMQDDPRGPLRLSPYQADLWAELEALGIVEQQSERWASLVKGLSAEAVEPLETPQGLDAELRPYQRGGFSWLTYLRRAGLGGVLADDMGLGKTMQALAMIVQARRDALAEGSGGAAPPWLVVAPASVVGVWAGEAAAFAPGLTVGVASTTSKRDHGLDQVPDGVDLVLTSYAVFRLDEKAFTEREWSGLILDEAQAVKNHQSAGYQCARRLEVPTKFAITGTPMENNLMELWALLSIVAPGLFPHPKAFTEHFRRPIETGSAPERLDTLRRRIRPVMLRRTKGEVARDLPAKQEQVVHVELPPRHRRVYDRGLARQRQRVLGLLEDADRNRIAIFRALTILRQLSLHPGLVEAEHVDQPCAKIDTLMELMSPVLAEGHQVLVFSQFTSFLTMVRDRLQAEGVSHSYLDGSTRNRARVVEEFRSGRTQAFVISLKAGGVGLTLTEADYVFVLDPWWNPAVEAQAIDRTHRIGQDKPVNVYRLVSADTIEDKVVALQDRKRELFSSVIDDGALASGALTADDIRGLL
ncbi:MAG: DEAD/DEAH box helicase [Kineosporiaceae bacterium]|nr:DEAD/DEAH box helicase [Kineosporiaceae bacterium]